MIRLNLFKKPGKNAKEEKTKSDNRLKHRKIIMQSMTFRIQ